MSDAAFKTVAVALGARSYDITIGRGVLADAVPGWRRLRRAAASPSSPTPMWNRICAGRCRRRSRLRGLRRTGVWCRRERPARIMWSLRASAMRFLQARIERGDLVVARAAAWWAISPALRRPACGAGCASCKFPQRCWRRSIHRSAARPASIHRWAKIWWARFHQPALVLCDTAVLDTLPRREFLAGYAEVVKYGLIDKPEFFRLA